MTGDKQRGDEMAVTTEWEQELDAYVDGLLDRDPQRLEAVERFLAERPALRARIDARRARNDAIRSAFDSVMQEPVPERFHEILDRPQPAGMARVVRNVAAMLALVLVGGVSGWWLGQDSGPAAPPADNIAGIPEAGLTAEAALAVTADKSPSNDNERRRLDLAVPDLRNLGLKEMERHVLTAADRPTLQVRYATVGGERIDLLIQERRVTSRPTYLEDERRAAAIWSGSEHIYALVARGDSEKVRRLTERVRTAIGVEDTPLVDSLPEIPELSEPLTMAPRSDKRVTDSRDGRSPRLIVPNVPEPGANGL